MLTLQCCSAVGDSSQLMVNFAVASRDFTEAPLFSLWIKLSYELYRHCKSPSLVQMFRFYILPDSFFPTPNSSSAIAASMYSLNTVAAGHRHWEPVARVNAYEYYYRLEQGADVKEHLFEKTLTPSDVGKLNRLVIPKQHAEKYFPLDGEAGERDLLMSFEDEAGKPWRFRYSYWGSSQSYVITKGWSRFVKEKALDAGDVVLFHRLRGAAGDRLCISCRRRSRAGASCTAATSMSPPECLAHGDASGGAAAPAQLKRLRLFGVNLEYLVPQSELPRLVNVHETGQVHAHH